MTETIIKRTTLIVSDADKSIGFYRDVLGMKVYYNQRMTVGGSILPAGEPGAEVHLGIMEGPDPDVGKIGLLQWTDPPLPDPGPYRQRLGIGDVVLVTETDDMAALAERLEASDDCQIHAPPEDWEVPLPNGSGTKPISTMSFFDRDGFFFEVNHKPTDPQPDGFVVRRTTLIVEDVDASLRLYRGALGLKTWYDQQMEIGGTVLPAGGPGSLVRVAILQCEAPDTGMLGIMGFIDPPIQAPPIQRDRLGVGDIVFVATAVDDLDRIYQKLRASPCRIHSQPVADTVTGADGVEIHMTTLSFFDPDGYFFELNERKPAG